MGDIFIARLHPLADKIYRIDINRYDKKAHIAVFGRIASVSDDIEFSGYPYPLVAAHRLARIDEYFRQEMRENIAAELEKLDISPRLWEFLSGDIHDKLNADLMMMARGASHG